MGGLKMKSAVIVQARNSSTRYPQKMLHKFLGKPAIEWVIDRCHKIDTDYKILATSTNEEDDILAEIAAKKGWNVVRGSVEDVLNRYAKAIQDYNIDVVVRITGDCILTDYRMVNYAISKFQELNADYLVLTNIIDGFDVEVIRANTVLDADKHAILPSEREHVTPYIKKSKRYKIVSLPYREEDLSSIHMSLDYKEDAIAIGLILERFNGRDFSYDDVAKLIKLDPQILDSVRHIIPNEGNQKTLKEDEEFAKLLKGNSKKLINE